MRTFLYRFCFFSLPILLLAFPLDYALSHYLRQSRTYMQGEYTVWNAIYKGGIKADVAIYGSSRAWVQFDPTILADSLHKTAYNFGIDGHNFWLQYLRHQQFLKYNAPPQHIVLSVDINTLAKNPNLYNSDQFLPYMLGDAGIQTFTKGYKGFILADYYLPLVRYYGKKSAINTAIKAAFYTDTTQNTRINGYQGQEREWNTDFDKAKKKRKILNVKIDTATLRLFEQFVQECAQKRIKLTLVYAPEYIEGQQFVRNRALIVALFQHFSAKYNLQFIDFSAHKISQNKAYFYNVLHLNKTGATVFSRELAHWLR